MTSKSDLVRELAHRSGITLAQSKDAIDGVVTIVAEHLRAGSDVRIDGLGVFKVKQTAERMGRNPQTGEQVRIAAGRKVSFKPAVSLKEAI